MAEAQVRAQFQPKRGLNPEARLAHLENFLAQHGIPVDVAGTTSESSGGGFGGSIPEAQVVFDPDAGHDHDGSNSHTVDHANLANVTADQHHAEHHNLQSADHPDVDLTAPTSGYALVWNGTHWAPAAQTATVTLAGDASGASGSNTVDKIKNFPVTAPTHPADDGKYLKFTGTGWAVDTPAGGGGTSHSPIGAWAKDDISSFTTSATELPNSWSKGANDHIAEIAPNSGTLTAIAVLCSGVVGGGTESVTFQVYVNGSPSALFVTLFAVSGDYKRIATGSVVVSQYDEITVYGVRSGTLNARLARVAVWGQF